MIIITNLNLEMLKIKNLAEGDFAFLPLKRAINALYSIKKCDY